MGLQAGQDEFGKKVSGTVFGQVGLVWAEKRLL